MRIPRPIYLILAISMLPFTEGHAAQAQTTSGIDWMNICNTVSRSSNATM